MKLINSLVDLMEENLELYGQIAQKTRDEAEKIQKGSLNELGEIVKEKETIALQLKSVERARGALLMKIAQKLKRPPAEITMTLLADRPENKKARGKLLDLREKLTEAAVSTRRQNDFNRSLIGRAVGSIRESLSYANSLLDPGVTYSGGRLIDVKIPAGRMVTRSY